MGLLVYCALFVGGLYKCATLRPGSPALSAFLGGLSGMALVFLLLFKPPYDWPHPVKVFFEFWGLFIMFALPALVLGWVFFKTGRSLKISAALAGGLVLGWFVGCLGNVLFFSASLRLFD